MQQSVWAKAEPQTEEPALAVCFAGGGCRTERRCIPSGGLVLGRDELGDPRAAAQHAAVHRRADGLLVLRDLGSPTGTRVNGERIGGERVLVPGDVVRLGNTLVVCTTSHGVPTVDPELVGSSPAIAAVRRSIEAVAPRRHAVVITGETGTGKEVVARKLHERSGRTGPFIAVNCSTFTDALLASELFGHVKGAFTGAVTEHAGLFRAARGGTLLLDELADIPLQVQACLLRVLETQTVRPVGATRDVEVDVRVLATTNRDLTDLVRGGRFRADLYARLAQWTIRTPPLAARREDVPELVGHLLPRVDGTGRRLAPDLCEALLLHEWPLNVRGLLNVLSIAVVSATGDGPLALTAEVADVLRATRSLTPDPAPEATGPSRSEAVWTPPRTLDRGELEQLMTRYQGHVAAAARHVGMTRPKLYRMLGACGLEPRQFRPGRP